MARNKGGRPRTMNEGDISTLPGSLGVLEYRRARRAGDGYVHVWSSSRDAVSSPAPVVSATSRGHGSRRAIGRAARPWDDAPSATDHERKNNRADTPPERLEQLRAAWESGGFDAVLARCPDAVLARCPDARRAMGR